MILTSFFLFTIVFTSNSQDNLTIYFKKNGKQTTNPDKSAFYRKVIKNDERFYFQEFITESNILTQESEIKSWEPLIEDGITTYFDEITGHYIAKGYYRDGKLSGKWIIKTKNGYDTINYEDSEIIYSPHPGVQKKETFFIVEKMPFLDYAYELEKSREILDMKIKQLNETVNSQDKKEKYLELQRQVIELNRQAFDKYKADNLFYPIRAKKKAIQGIVYLQFVIDESGKVVETEIVRGVNEDLDKEAVRLINSMNCWTAGLQKEEPVRVAMTVGVKFE